jgi:hypothetical protein
MLSHITSHVYDFISVWWASLKRRTCERFAIALFVGIGHASFMTFLTINIVVMSVEQGSIIVGIGHPAS